MLKSVYDPDLDGDVDALAAHKTSHQYGGSDEIDVIDLSGELADDQPPKKHTLHGNKHNSATLAQFNDKISDATLDKNTDTRPPTTHKTNHQHGESDEINVTGLVGTTPRAILGDATAGRVFRAIIITIANGTNASTLKCTVASRWNGDAIAEQDNIAKDATTGHFKLNAAGTWLTILNTGLTGNALFGMANLYNNASATSLLASVIKMADGLLFQTQGLSDGTAKDLTVLVDTGTINIHSLYITDA